MRKVHGHCPDCGAEQLALTNGCRIVCCALGCERPTAAAEILGDAETGHIVDLAAGDFTVLHPLRERLDDALLSCRLHGAIAASSGPPAPPGRYLAHLGPDGLELTPITTSERRTR